MAIAAMIPGFTFVCLSCDLAGHMTALANHSRRLGGQERPSADLVNPVLLVTKHLKLHHGSNFFEVILCWSSRHDAFAYAISVRQGGGRHVTARPPTTKRPPTTDGVFSVYLHRRARPFRFSSTI
ncbi:hypothetical protein SAICODRAFT_65759, partial [Saitoella complicata NRRL Y-17804]|uniref:uncharacterized protein n=1 Tax=Saitoella complicata (strain BCRC 22490 / CBS 7301 / JCM 7358 / NBRC 10748 / NRRL Y-17804) TaxID=698492 RepID=UPI0008681424